MCAFNAKAQERVNGDDGKCSGQNDVDVNEEFVFHSAALRVGCGHGCV